MRKIAASTLLAVCCFLMAMLIAYILSGCTSTKQVYKETTDSSHLKELEAQNRVLYSENERLLKEVRELQYAEVRFDTVFLKGDTVVNTITITKEGEVKATGKIVSANLTKNVLTKIVKEKDRIIDSLSQLKQKETVKVVTEYKDKYKKVTVFPWWFLMITGAFAFLWLRKQFK